MARLGTEMVRSTQDAQTDPTAHNAETPREILGDPFYTHPHWTTPALATPGEVGTTRCQVAGQILPARQGWSALPAPSVICLPLLALTPRPPENRVADGTWGLRWQEQGSAVSCCCCWERRAAHLVGRNPNLPEAAGNRLGLGEGQWLPGQSWAHSMAPQD